MSFDTTTALWSPVRRPLVRREAPHNQRIKNTIMPNTSFTEETTLLVEALAKARLRFYDGTGHGQLAPYRHIVVRDSVPFEWGPYHSMLEDQASHLTNDINAFGYRIGQLEAWGSVLPEYEMKDQLVLLMELVDPIATTAVGTPYTIRSRLIFSVSHLSHQANRITRSGWLESNLPTDKEINYKTMIKMAESWTTFPALKIKLDMLSDKKLNIATGDFRDKYNHRLPPRFQQGHTQTVSRSWDKSTGVTTYGFGSVEPLRLDKLTPVLREQHSIALSAFEHYSELAREQLRTIYV